MSPTLNAHGVSVTPPAGFEGRVFRRPAFGEVAASAADGPPAPPAEMPGVVVHVSTIALPTDIGDFASGAVDQLQVDDVLVILFEYDAGKRGPAAVRAEGPAPAPDRRRLQPQRPAAHDSRSGRLPVLLQRRRPRLLPVRGDRLLRPARGARRQGELGLGDGADRAIRLRMGAGSPATTVPATTTQPPTTTVVPPTSEPSPTTTTTP